ncbi:MAG: hypothetical protein GXX99_04850 [Clostridiales bacterium]|nr:hypothetical protein [Clostridiales bacterium]
MADSCTPTRRCSCDRDDDTPACACFRRRVAPCPDQPFCPPVWDIGEDREVRTCKTCCGQQCPPPCNPNCCHCRRWNRGCRDVGGSSTGCNCTCRCTCRCNDSSDDCRPQPCRPPVVITSPANKSTVSNLTHVSGTGSPCATVTVTVAGHRVQTTVDNRGNWTVTLPCALPTGVHEIVATMRGKNGCVSTATVRVRVQEPSLAEPIIDFPAEGSTICGDRPSVGGRANPCACVQVCILGVGCWETMADQSGYWSCRIPVRLADGCYTVTARQTCMGETSAAASNNFVVCN